MEDPIELIEEIESDFDEIIRIARRLSRLTSNRICSGQIESYLIPWMKAFKEDNNQPGSLASIRRMLDSDLYS
jgi:hypothetical protein